MKFNCVIFISFFYRVLSETRPEISFELKETSKLNWDLIPLNGIPKYDNGNNISTFLVLEGYPVNISAYDYKNINCFNDISSIEIFESNGARIPTEAINCFPGHPRKTTIQINYISHASHRTWTLVLQSIYFNEKIYISFKVHIRRTVDIPTMFLSNDNITSIIRKYRTLSTQRADYCIKNYDAFGLLYYNGYQHVLLQCNSITRRNYTSIEWNMYELKNISTKGLYTATYANYIKPENNGSFIECIERTEMDETVIRVIFVNNMGDENYFSSGLKIWVTILLTSIAVVFLIIFLYCKCFHLKSKRGSELILNYKAYGNNTDRPRTQADVNDMDSNYANIEAIELHEYYQLKAEVNGEEVNKHADIKNSLYIPSKLDVEPSRVDQYVKSNYEKNEYTGGDDIKNNTYCYVYAKPHSIQAIAEARAVNQDNGYANSDVTVLPRPPKIINNLNNM